MGGGGNETTHRHVIAGPPMPTEVRGVRQMAKDQIEGSAREAKDAVNNAVGGIKDTLRGH
jgi:hypothetical protein